MLICGRLWSAPVMTADPGRHCVYGYLCDIRIGIIFSHLKIYLLYTCIQQYNIRTLHSHRTSVIIIMVYFHIHNNSYCIKVKNMYSWKTKEIKDTHRDYDDILNILWAINGEEKKIKCTHTQIYV